MWTRPSQYEHFRVSDVMNRKLSKSIMLFNEKIKINLMFSFRQLIKYISGYIPGWGIKIDVILGRVNSAVTFRLLNKGEFKGNCFELCGQGHLSTSILGLVM